MESVLQANFDDSWYVSKKSNCIEVEEEIGGVCTHSKVKPDFTADSNTIVLCYASYHEQGYYIWQ